MELELTQPLATFALSDVGVKYVVYDAENIIYGDTDSTYISLDKLFDRSHDPKDVTEFADELGDWTNAQFPEFMDRVFNVKGEAAKVIETEREVVSDKSVFMTKKKYAMHIINKEGVEVDEEKIMGMEIVKSDTPQVLKDFLKNIIRMLMDRATYDEVRKVVEDFRQEYRTMDLMTVGTPKSVRVLKKYEDIVRETGNFKGVPYHVRASMFYNSLCEGDDQRIRGGDKVALTYINHRDSKYIAVPIDADVVPSFIEGLEIDWDKQLELVDKKVEAYLKPIGYDRDARRQQYLETVIEF